MRSAGRPAWWELLKIIRLVFGRIQVIPWGLPGIDRLLATLARNPFGERIVVGTGACRKAVEPAAAIGASTAGGKARVREGS